MVQPVLLHTAPLVCLGIPPAGTLHLVPPRGCRNAKVFVPLADLCGQQSLKDETVAEFFGFRDVPGLVDELLEPPVRYFVLVQVKGGHRHRARRRFVIGGKDGLVGTDQILSARNQAHMFIPLGMLH
uniref:Putative secreted protein n=1 Tax=Anopheles triannulatus TaxID=58253 RepID=A0A2M4B4V6_9DIPT